MNKVLITLPLREKRMTAINQYIKADCIPDAKNIYAEVAKRIGEYEGLILMGPIEKLDAAILQKAKKLKIISNYGVGYDKIDTKFAKANNIIVANTPHSVTVPTADLALALMLSLCRRVVASDRAIRQNKLKRWYNTPLPSTSLNGKLLGIIGMGRIGKAVAQRAKAFGMKIIYYQRTPLSFDLEEKYDATYFPLPNLLKQSDIVSLHVPLNDSTYHLLGDEELALLQPTAFIVNTARGSVIDEKALIKHLKENKIGGAALDVFVEEPRVPSAFLEMEKVILTPHIGTATGDARGEMLKEAIQNLVEYFSGKEVTNRVA